MRLPKTIRHDVFTELRRRAVAVDQVSVLLYYRPTHMERMTAVYAEYDPRYLTSGMWLRHRFRNYARYHSSKE